MAAAQRLFVGGDAANTIKDGESSKIWCRSRMTGGFMISEACAFIALSRLIGWRQEAGGGSHWLCRCDCGSELVCNGLNLRHGTTKSCGCGVAALREKNRRSTAKHGLYGTPMYKLWQRIIARTEYEKSDGFMRYGARGIRIWDGWRHDPARFCSDVGPHPGDGFSLDRIDNDKGYEPGNIRWITDAEQHRNKTTNRFVEVDGRPLVLADAARAMGMSVTGLTYRVDTGKISECAAPSGGAIYGAAHYAPKRDRPKKERINKGGRPKKSALPLAAKPVVP